MILTRLPLGLQTQVWIAKVLTMVKSVSCLVAHRKVNSNNVTQKKFCYASRSLSGVPHAKRMLNAQIISSFSATLHYSGESYENLQFKLGFSSCLFYSCSTLFALNGERKLGFYRSAL